MYSNISNTNISHKLPTELEDFTLYSSDTQQV